MEKSPNWTKPHSVSGTGLAVPAAVVANGQALRAARAVRQPAMVEPVRWTRTAATWRSDLDGRPMPRSPRVRVLGRSHMDSGLNSRRLTPSKGDDFAVDRVVCSTRAFDTST